MSREPSIAIFLFYNIANGKQSILSFSAEFRHCNVIVYDGQYLSCVEMDAEGLKLIIREVTDINKFIDKLRLIPELTALLTVYVERRFKRNWKPLLVRSCNEISRIISGIDIGFTFNPKHLYRKILKYDLNGYQVISAWRRTEYGHVFE